MRLRVFILAGLLLLLLPVPGVFPQTNAPSGSSLRSDLQIGEIPDLFIGASFEERAIFSQAKAFFDQGNYEIARSSLEGFLLSHSNSPLLPDAYLLLGETYAAMGKGNRAAEHFQTFIDLFPDELRLKAVQHRLSGLYFSLGDLKKVLALWEGIENEEVSKHIVYDKLVSTYVKRKAYLEALRVLVKKAEISTDSGTRAFAEQEMVRFIREKLQEEDLKAVVDEFGATFPADEAMVRLIHLFDVKGDYYREEQMVLRFLSEFPGHPFATQARKSLERIAEKIKRSRYLIAVILPLSGRLAPFGANALDGAELAVQLFKEELPGASVGLAVRDSVGDPSRLRLTSEEWLKEYQPVAVVGPLLSKEVNRIAPMVEKAGLALISPGATSTRLFSLGESVFRNAVTNRFLCNAIAEYAVLELEVERFAVLFPDETLGKRWVGCFSEGVEKLGGEVILTERYPLNNTDFSSTILRLKKADLEDEGYVDELENEDGELEEVYIPGFDAIFLPADTVRAGLIIPQLLFHEFGQVNIIGTSSWHSPEFLKLVGTNAEGVVFVDGFFKGSPEPVVQTFVREFKARFHRDPDLFAAQTYDATRVILAALRKGALTPAAVKASIAETIDFPGASGFIYEVSGGEFIKEPFYLSVEHGKFIQVN
ncbi:MAG: ABC transporter substrate-binding protein [Nitrospiria bacterium]